MNYGCLRNCFVKDRLYHSGETYDLPDGFPIDPKNFVALKVRQVVEATDEPDGGVTPATETKAQVDATLEAGEPSKEKAPIEQPEESVAPPAKVKPDKIGKGKFWCTKCEAIHKEAKRNGKPHAHLKHKA